jgi:ribulose-5-phosphate 4-epimerase/fuculose-1-phosphate aldolase
MWAGELAIHTTYEGAVNQVSNASDVVDALGDAEVALLGNHGVLVLGKTITEAYMRSMVLEWRCRQAWHVEALGTGVPLDRDVVDNFRRMIDAHPTAFDGHFEAMARRVIRRDPGVLD